MIGYLIWIVSIIIGMIIGHNKRRMSSGILWTFLLGPIGLVIILLLPEIKDKKTIVTKEFNSIEYENMKSNYFRKNN